MQDISGLRLTAYHVKNQIHRADSAQILQTKQKMGQAETKRMEDRDTVVLSGQKSPILSGSVTMGQVPLTFALPERQESTSFTHASVSDAAKRLSACMDEKNEDMHWKIMSGMSEKQLAEHFGQIGRQIDDAFASGEITRQEYDDLNRGLETYTEFMVSKSEREAAKWEVVKQGAAKIIEQVKSGASDADIDLYAQMRRKTFRDTIEGFVKEYCSIDRVFLQEMIRHVRSGGELVGVEQDYGRQNTAGYFKNGYVPFVPVSYP